MPTPIRSLDELDLTQTYTYADYLTWQVTEWVELFRGKVMRRMSPAPTDVHQAVTGELYLMIASYLRHKRCKVRIAPYDVRLTTKGPNAADDAITTVVQPDLCVICDPTKIDARGCNGAPDWVLEILSPGTAARDWKAKFDLYEENGVNEYWIISPTDQTIAVFVRHAATNRYTLQGEYAGPGLIPCQTLPELVVEWTEIFAVD